MLVFSPYFADEPDSDRQLEAAFLIMVHPIADVEAPARTAKAPPARIWQASDPPFKGYKDADQHGWQKSSADTAIVIDNGMLSQHIRKQARKIG